VRVLVLVRSFYSWFVRLFQSSFARSLDSLSLRSLGAPRSVSQSVRLSVSRFVALCVTLNLSTTCIVHGMGLSHIELKWTPCERKVSSFSGQLTAVSGARARPLHEVADRPMVR